MLRELQGALFAGAARRRRSPEHERIFFQLLGYSLRPGFGYALDDWRCEQSATLFSESIQFHREKAVWNEFWVCWRRVAGGQSRSRHEEIWSYLKPFLASRVPPNPFYIWPNPKALSLMDWMKWPGFLRGYTNLGWVCCPGDRAAERNPTRPSAQVHGPLALERSSTRAATQVSKFRLLWPTQAQASRGQPGHFIQSIRDKAFGFGQMFGRIRRDAAR